MSKVKPILFNTDMVRAILDGRKTVTRRCVKDAPENTYRFGFDTFGKGYCAIDADENALRFVKSPYQIEDILYVRETWCYVTDLFGEFETYMYKADGDFEDSKWKPSIHMPKEAARIWLKVTDVRVERLQECGKVGVLKLKKRGVVTPQSPILYINDDAFHDALREEFKKLWNSTIKKSDLDRYGWDASPWVWVIEFERCEKPEGE